ncbi:hypothetical protein YPPY34_3232, partial [Yersinia pestis PY-34]|jgi:hypothetical protein
MSKNL